MKTNNTLNNIIVFAAGAIVGSVVTWKIVKTKCDKEKQEEIDSVKEVYSKRFIEKDDVESVEEDLEEDEPFDEEDMVEYEDLIEKSGYVTESNDTIQNEEEVKKEMDRPYVISPDEFGEKDEHEIISLRYYANDVLVDEFGGVMPKDIWEEYVGADFAEHFGEYEDDSVFVRNDTFGVDYEILKDLDPYTGDN